MPCKAKQCPITSPRFGEGDSVTVFLSPGKRSKAIQTITQTVERFRPRVASKIRCPQAVDDVLQESAIAAWRAGVDDFAYIARTVHSKIQDFFRRGGRRSALHHDHLTDLEEQSAQSQEERDLSLSDLASADPTDVADALAYERGEVERTPAERKAQQRRLERIKSAVK